MITIFGAGIAGLTSALELVKKGFKVRIYEKDDAPGGMAKTKRKFGVPSEHSWRGFFKFYNNIFDVLEQIPINETFINNEYTSDEVSTHNKKEDGWIIYKNNIYDITDFINTHQGGNIIIKALGKDIEKIWKENGVEWHMKHINLDKIPEIKKVGKLKTIEKFKSNNTAINNIYSNLQMKIYNNKITPKSDLELITNNLPLLYHFLVFSTSNLRAEKYYSSKLTCWFSEEKSKYSYDYFVNMVTGPGLGLDKNSCSIGTYFHFMNLELGSTNKFPTWSVMKKPTSEGFIDPLVTLLLSYGVEIYYNTELKLINYDNNKIVSCVISDKEGHQIITSEEYIIAINPNNCYDIFNESKMETLANQHLELSTVNNQISFRIGIKNKILFNENNSGRVLVDSPYNITFYAQDHFFNVPIDPLDKIKSLWSGTCVQTYNPGTLYNKSGTSLNLDELIKEIINQILICDELQNEIKKVNGKYLEKEDIIYTDIWEDWYWNGKNLESQNKKWVNTIHNEKYKPLQKTEYNNLYLAGAHTQTSFKIWSMEAACESGKLVANHILEKNNMNKCKIYNNSKPLYFKIFECLDDYLYKLNLPSVIDLFIILVIIEIVKKIKK